MYNRPILGALLCVSLFATTVSASPRYALREIEPLRGDTRTTALDINDKGEVLGISTTLEFDLPNATPFVWKQGVSAPLEVDHQSSVFPRRINNNSVVVGGGSGGKVRVWREGIQSQYPERASLLEHYVVGVSDLDVVTGYARGNLGRKAGFSLDLRTGIFQYDRRHDFGDSNANGQMLRFTLSDPITGELQAIDGAHALAVPSSLRPFGSADRATLGESGVVMSSLTDNDSSDGCSGCGSSCVRWSPPSFQPEVFNPANYDGGDYCKPIRPNSSGATVVTHSVEIVRDEEYRTDNYLVRGRIYSNLRALCPELARYSSYTINAINDRGQIVGIGYRDGISRGFILTQTLVAGDGGRVDITGSGRGRMTISGGVAGIGF